MVNTWSQLERIRAAGQRPFLPIIVTTNRRLPWNLDGVGAMTILHQRGEAMPIELLEGLNVILMLNDCEQAANVNRLRRAKSVMWKSCAAWCECEKTLTTCVGRCDASR